MKKALMAGGSPLDWSMLGLVLFTLIFFGIIVWTFRRGSKTKYNAIAALATNEEYTNE